MPAQSLESVDAAVERFRFGGVVSRDRANNPGTAGKGAKLASSRVLDLAEALGLV